jgi:hypothetical protein
LSSAVLRYYKSSVISALPMQHEVQPVGLRRDDDFFVDGA